MSGRKQPWVKARARTAVVARQLHESIGQPVAFLLHFSHASISAHNPHSWRILPRFRKPSRSSRRQLRASRKQLMGIHRRFLRWTRISPTGTFVLYRSTFTVVFRVRVDHRRALVLGNLEETPSCCIYSLCRVPQLMRKFLRCIDTRKRTNTHTHVSTLE